MNDLDLDELGYPKGNWSNVVFDIQRELRKRGFRAGHGDIARMAGLNLNVVWSAANGRHRSRKRTVMLLLDLRNRVMSGQCMCGCCERET